MDGLFDIRLDALGLPIERRSDAAEVRTALLITLAVTVLTVGALLTLGVFGIASFPAAGFPGFQDAGLLG